MKTIRLWNDKTYTHDQIADSSAQLLEYAIKHPKVLEEILEKKHRAPLLVRLFRLFSITLATDFFALYIWTRFDSGTTFHAMGGQTATPIGLLILVLATVCAYLFFAAPRFGLPYPFPRLTKIHDGLIRLYVDGRFLKFGRLEDTYWHCGWMTEDYMGSRLPRRRCFILSCASKPTYQYNLSRRNIAVGTTDETYKIWDALLRISDIPRLRNTSKHLFLSIAAASLLGFFASHYLANGFLHITGIAQDARPATIFSLIFIFTATLTCGLFASVFAGSDYFYHRFKILLLWFSIPGLVFTGLLYFANLPTAAIFILGMTGYLLLNVWFLSILTNYLRTKVGLNE